MQLQQNDIIRDENGYYRKVHAVIGNTVFVSESYKLIESVEKASNVYAYPTSHFINATLIERNGVPHVEKAWEPEDGEAYYAPSPQQISLYFEREFNKSSDFDHHIQGLGHMYPHTEAGRLDAIAKAERMLNTK